MDIPSFSVIVPTHDTRELTLRCLSSLRAGGATPVDVIVVDDASSDGTAEEVRTSDHGITVVETDGNVGFSRAVNLGAEKTTGDVILVLNSDTEVLEGGLAALLAAFSDDDALGIGGAGLLEPDGTPQWSAGRWPTPTWFFAQASGLGSVASRLPGRKVLGSGGAAKSGAVDWVSGAAMAIRREVWESCGPFDVDYRFYCQDLDLCYAARQAGWTVTVIPNFRVLHHHGATISNKPGASGAFHPAHLWTDLVHFTAKHEGHEAARRTATALRAGARLRLIGRAIAAPFSADRAVWKRDSEAFREGLKALDDESSNMSP